MGRDGWRRAAIALALACAAGPVRAAGDGWSRSVLVGSPKGARRRGGKPRPASRRSGDPLAGAKLRFLAARVEAPDPLDCDAASYEVVRDPFTNSQEPAQAAVDACAAGAGRRAH